MGYTNYWHRTNKEFDGDFVELVKDVFKRSAERGIILKDGWGENEPIADSLEICFNGNAETGLEHETFFLPNTDNEHFKSGFDFCKTAEKPYDWTVKEVLRLAEKYGYVTDVSDDGEPEILNDEEYIAKYGREV